MSPEHHHDPFDPARHAVWLDALGHYPLPDGRCEHHWRNRQRVAVRCAFLDGFRAGLSAPADPDDVSPEALTCWRCEGRGWVRNGDLDDGMMTGRDDCPVCFGSGRVSEAQLEAAISRMREVAWHSQSSR